MGIDRPAHSTRDVSAPQVHAGQRVTARIVDQTAGASFHSRARPVLDIETERAARAFMRRLAGKYLTIGGLIFGSRARGTHRADSDADIAVILKGERGDRSAAVIDMAGIAVEVMMETGILVEALPLWESEFRRPESFSNPALIEKIRREGLLF